MNEDTIDMSVIDIIPYIQNSPPSKILDTSGNILNSFDTTPSLSTQINLIATPKKASKASIKSVMKYNSQNFLVIKFLKK